MDGGSGGLDRGVACHGPRVGVMEYEMGQTRNRGCRRCTMVVTGGFEDLSRMVVA